MKCVNGFGTFDLLWKTIPYQASRVFHITFRVFSPRLRWDKTTSRGCPFNSLIKLMKTRCLLHLRHSIEWACPPTEYKQKNLQWLVCTDGDFCHSVHLFGIVRPVHVISVSHNYIWAKTWQNQQSDCTPSKDSDQPGHPPSLIRVFAVHLMDS